MTTNTGVHFMLLNMIRLSEPTKAPSLWMLSPSRVETSLGASNGLQHIQYSAGNFGNRRNLAVMRLQTDGQQTL